MDVHVHYVSGETILEYDGYLVVLIYYEIVIVPTQGETQPERSPRHEAASLIVVVRALVPNNNGLRAWRGAVDRLNSQYTQLPTRAPDESKVSRIRVSGVHYPVEGN